MRNIVYASHIDPYLVFIYAYYIQKDIITEKFVFFLKALILSIHVENVFH